MNCNLSRSQKSKANELQKSILNVIAEQSKLQHEYGEFYAYLDFVNQLEKRGIVLFNDKKERAEFLGMCLLGECLRKIAINNPQLFLNDDTPKEYKTDNLYIGQTVANYRKLCELLEVEPKTGKSRQLQEKDFFRYFDYEKLKYSNEYLILDIYDTPLQKNEQAKNSLYCNALKLMIMYELTKAPIVDKDNIYTIYTTLNELIRKLELLTLFFNKDITDYLIDKYSALTEQDISEIDRNEFKKKIHIFKTLTRRKHKSNINYALKRLKEQNMIHYDSYSMIIERVDGKKNYRQADFNEEVLIESAKREAAKSIGFKNSNTASLFNPKAYNKELDKIYHRYGWLGVFNQIKIGADSKMLSTPINEYTNYYMIDDSVLDLSDKERILYKKAYIDNVSLYFTKSAENKHTLTKQRITEDLDTEQLQSNQYTFTELENLFGISSDSFLQDNDNLLTLQKLFIEYFISPNDNSISEYKEYYNR